ncbi:N-acetylglutamate synthase, CG3035 family [Mycobacterium branderi]|uniref:GNAT family N-acetyltransferase n=1 Tax=Mycobacterium branderi TaxID=43348 RepID=A0A7I7W1I3_9MYCO|nr:GNAT family N-acetyltransferase [Mycobacterium branderi]MCV7236142.1 GNAT family N-acetyltransferase [Mycobacterium branderi]ORA32026.1 GNAT family N-acetyltransferase [Mycobacterium branderi]BBZ10827.1 hypothetical protein MBRA_10220 [Mycobacterium branderi]
MVSWPDLGTRVTVRYRRPAGSVPPLTDAVGHLLAVAPLVRVRTKSGRVVQFSPADVVAVRALTDAPVRTSQIRALEHAAALARPGLERQWLDGWLLRAAPGADIESNSAVLLDVSASLATVPAIVDWYAQRRLTPLLAVADRLLRLTDPGVHAHRMLVRGVSTAEPDPAVRLTASPDDDWLRCYHRAEPVEVLTTVLDGELAFGTHDHAAARATVTNAPDGTRWVGLSAISDERLCEALLAWGATRGATRGYVRVLDDDHAAGSLLESLGFTAHHRGRYLDVHTL